MQVKPMPASSAAVAREVQSKPFLIHTKGTLQDKLWLEDIIWTVLSDELDSKVPGIEVGTKKKEKKEKRLLACTCMRMPMNFDTTSLHEFSVLRLLVSTTHCTSNSKINCQIAKQTFPA